MKAIQYNGSNYQELKSFCDQVDYFWGRLVIWMDDVFISIQTGDYIVLDNEEYYITTQDLKI